MPDADLDTLAAALGVSRSAMNHRLRRLVELASEEERLMRRTGSIAGNWKMNPPTRSTRRIALADAVRARGRGAAGVDDVVCPPTIHLAPAS